MPIGKVKWFDSKKGFGFIIHGDGRDIFVHYSVIEGHGFRRLVDKELVEYEIAQGPKGLLAARVRRIGPASAAPPAPGHNGDGTLLPTPDPDPDPAP
jgi:CspA family cold shock protein